MAKRIPDDIDAAAAEWVSRRDAGLQPMEQADLDRWRTEDPRHAAALARFERTWTVLGRPRRAGDSSSVAHGLADMSRRRRWRNIGLATTVAALVMAAVHWRSAVIRPAAPLANTTVLRLPEHRALTDGSIVDFPPGAEFDVSYNTKVRHVTLKRGTAFFKVAKNRLRPFIVQVDGFEVRAVGTAFSVRLARSQIEVLVAEGRVAVDRTAARGGHVAIVDSGKCADLDSRQGAIPSIVSVSPSEMAARLAWRRPRLEFSGAPLTQVVNSINRYNPVHFVIADSSLNAVQVSGLFLADDTDMISRMLEAGFGIRAERSGENEIVLRRTR